MPGLAFERILVARLGLGNKRLMIDYTMMTETEKLVSKIAQEIGNLPEESLREVLDFVERLSNGEEPDGIKASANREPEHDPILGFIGGVSHGSLAQEIDRELYGGGR